jgi:parallel beta-helix repeat protein
MSNLINTGNRGITGRARMEGLEDRRLFSTFMVSNTNDSGSGSLRQALLNANNNAGADTVKFSIGSGARTITPYSQLPILNGPVVIDGTSQPGYAGKPIIEINGANAGSGFVNGIWLDGGGSVVKGLVINRFADSGIFMNTKGGNTIYNCYIGTDITGSYAQANHGHGILVQSGGNLISHNVISGNSNQGVCLYISSASGNRLEGNYIGTNAAGTGKIGNAKSGVHVCGAANTTIGGALPGSGNLISGNREDGIVINQGGATNNYILGNRIGVTVLGNKRLGNGMYGVEISQPNNIVGGGAKGWGNVISANGQSGVVLWLSSANGNRISGNFVGTDVTGKRDLGNLTRGVEATNGAYNNIIGGSTARMRNVISGNDQGGIGIYSGSWGNRVQSNYVGLTTTGYALPNGVLGVILTDGAGTNTLILRAGTQTTSNGILPNDKALL